MPAMNTSLSTRKVLIMEWVHGDRLRTAYTSAAAPGVSSSGDDLRLVEIGVRCSLEQMLEEGFYHAGEAGEVAGGGLVSAVRVPHIRSAWLAVWFHHHAVPWLAGSVVPVGPVTPPCIQTTAWPCPACRPPPRQSAAHAGREAGLPGLRHVWAGEPGKGGFGSAC